MEIILEAFQQQQDEQRQITEIGEEYGIEVITSRRMLFDAGIIPLNVNLLLDDLSPSPSALETFGDMLKRIPAAGSLVQRVVFFPPPERESEISYVVYPLPQGENLMAIYGNQPPEVLAEGFGQALLNRVTFLTCPEGLSRINPDPLHPILRTYAHVVESPLDPFSQRFIMDRLFIRGYAGAILGLPLPERQEVYFRSNLFPQQGSENPWGFLDNPERTLLRSIPR